MTAAVRVLLVDDQVLILEGLRKLLEIEPGIEITGAVPDGAAALAAAEAGPPDVALVDAHMPGMDGVALIAALRAARPEVACLVLSTFDDDAYVIGALRAGACGYLLKDCAPGDLVRAVHRAHAGETVLDGPAAARVVASLRQGAAPRQDFPGAELLSVRERQIAEMVAAGAANREIAARLSLTEGTVKNHVSAVLRKLGLRDRTRLAIHMGGR